MKLLLDSVAVLVTSVIVGALIKALASVLPFLLVTAGFVGALGLAFWSLGWFIGIAK